MQFVTNGPDIPDKLLQAHEEGRVVFFCGAGISHPAGLPGFEGLVDEIYRLVGTVRTPIEQNAYNRGQFDTTLDLLERRLPGGSFEMRSRLVESLKPNFRRKGATDTHAALLRLARSRKGDLHLVTTNFDRIFERAAKKIKIPFTSYGAPTLPIPKRSRWNGLVYLHGMLTLKNDASALSRLVVTSGDFGLAYLTERWAARFVSEMFRNFIVCFVGYRINDPVLRYMMDALAADRRLGETAQLAYAFSHCEASGQESAELEWEAKGVVPVLYDSGKDHAVLHATLKSWAEVWQEGTLGKERIVVNTAIAHPTQSTKQDDFVGRMIWALSDKSGVPARKFADLNPVPALEWLDAFCEKRYTYADLSRFGVPSTAEADNKLSFSLMKRPASYNVAPWMSVCSNLSHGSDWDKVMVQIAHWLTHHLNDPKLILWFSDQGGQLHERFAALANDELNKINARERTTDTGESAGNLDSTSSKLIRKLWGLMLSGRIKTVSRDLDLYKWKTHLKREGLSILLRLRLRELLTPVVKLRKAFQWEDLGLDESESPRQPREPIDWEVVLTSNNVKSTLNDLADNEQWLSALPCLFNDFQQLLRDALDLMRELDGTNDDYDPSYMRLPSVSPHDQNHGYCDWVFLIELLRDSWIAIRAGNPEQATRIALDWFSIPYPTFKRLALFAASQDTAITSNQWARWLLDDNSKWLWSSTTKRETLRLLTLRGAQLSPQMQKRLERAILKDFPREIFIESMGANDLQMMIDREIWVYLSRLSSSAVLGSKTQNHLIHLSQKYPKWILAADERDEFSVWSTSSSDDIPDVQQYRERAPDKRRDLVELLKKEPHQRRGFYDDVWQGVCRKHPVKAGFALKDLATEGKWPADRWSDAFYAWSEKRRALKTWRCFAPSLDEMPPAVLGAILHSVTWWMQAVSRLFGIDDLDRLIKLCRRLLAFQAEADSGADYIEGETKEAMAKAINHPVGHITRSLINIWFKSEPNDNDGLPDDIKQIFSEICDVRIRIFRYGRVCLATHLIALYRVDRSWTESHMLPLFDWKDNLSEAPAVWQGFFWSPRAYWPLLVAIKPNLLEAVNHYTELGEHRHQFIAFLTYIALDPDRDYTGEELRTVVSALAKEELDQVAITLAQALESAGTQKEEFWGKRIWPFLRDLWPKSKNNITSTVTESFARICIASGNEFPTALSDLLHWLRPIHYWGHVLLLLSDSGLCARFPSESLQLLNAIIENPEWGSEKLESCLDSIVSHQPDLAHDQRFLRLKGLI